MDSFEQVIASILERKGYWTKTCLKVRLNKEDKAVINRKSSPRWELDVVGYSGRDHHLMVLECKSFLDSTGVLSSTFEGKNPEDEKRYKLFFEDTLREVVLGRLASQLTDDGFCAADPKITFGLAAGNITGEVAVIERQFKSRGWVLWTPIFIREELAKLRDSGYENNVASVVAKLLLR